MWLVQRLERNDYASPDAKGIDRVFRMDYMGSAEFEFGELPKTLKKMREATESEIVLQKIEHAMRDEKGKKITHKAYFVGPATLSKVAQEFFTSELTGENKKRLKEPTFIQHAYQETSEKSHYRRYVGWWVLDDESPWAILKTDELAREWKRLVYQPCEPGS